MEKESVNQCMEKWNLKNASMILLYLSRYRSGQQNAFTMNTSTGY